MSIKTFKRVPYVITAGLFSLVLSIVGLMPATPVFAAGEGLSTVTNKTGELGSGIAIADLQITGTGNDPLMLNLYAPSGSFNFAAPTATITGSDNNVTLTGTRSEINQSLSVATFTSAGVGTVTIKASLGSNAPNIYVNPDNGHGYSIIEDGDMTWQEARDAAEELYYGGVQGYLATITSQEENDFIQDNLANDGWIGASDADNEGDEPDENEGNWYWVTGPEAGTHFWTGLGGVGQAELGPGDVPYYNNWNVFNEGGEPNNSGNEDCAQFYAGDEEDEGSGQNGTWNDLSCTNDTLESYVVEFGADGNLPNQIERSFTVTVNPRTITINNCEELQDLWDENMHDNIVLGKDIDCAGLDFVPLMPSHEGQIGYRGVFDGNGYTISNVSIDSEEENAGIFAEAYDAEFKDLNVNNITITSHNAWGVGALVGYAENTDVSNVHVSNVNIWSDDGGVGGLIGYLESYREDDPETNFNHITNVSVDGGSIYGDYEVGGLIGAIYWGDALEDELLIDIAYTNVDVEAGGSDGDVGGLVGYLDADYDEDEANTTVTIRDAYSWSNVYAPDGENIGGIVGHFSADSYEGTVTAKLERVYSNGDVTGYEEVGGLIGEICDAYDNDIYIIKDSFAASKVTVLSEDEGGILVGALFGNGNGSDLENGITVSNLYYDQVRAGIDTAGPIEGLDNEVSVVNTTGNQNNYFINNITNAPLNTWDFDDIWVANQHIMPTFKPVTDFDRDGIEDDVEVNAPNNGDGNNDGIPDNQQTHVASLVSPVSGSYITVAVSDSCSLSEVSISNESSHTVQDSAYNYTSGFVNFTATGCDDDQTAVQLYYHGVSPSSLTLRKYNPTTNAYFTITSANLSALSAPLDGTLASYTIVDNDDLDINATNGVITDPVGLAGQTVGSPNTGLAQ